MKLHIQCALLPLRPHGRLTFLYRMIHVIRNLLAVIKDKYTFFEIPFFSFLPHIKLSKLKNISENNCKGDDVLIFLNFIQFLDYILANLKTFNYIYYVLNFTKNCVFQDIFQLFKNSDKYI